MYFAGKLIEEGLPRSRLPSGRSSSRPPLIFRSKNLVLEKKLKLDR